MTGGFISLAQILLRKMLRGGGAIARRGLNGPVDGHSRLHCGFSDTDEAAADEHQRGLGATAPRRLCAAPAERSPKGDSVSDIESKSAATWTALKTFAQKLAAITRRRRFLLNLHRFPDPLL